MQKLSVIVLLLALCTASHGYGYQGRQLMQGSSAQAGSSSKADGRGGPASSSSSVSIGTTGGSVKASATADSRATAKAKSKIIELCEYIYNQVEFEKYTGGPKYPYCKSAYSLIDQYIVAYGEASAEAYAGTTAYVNVVGRGSGCAGSSASAKSQARSYAQIVGEAVSEANIGRYSSKARAAVNIVSELLVQAFAKSYSSACQTKEGRASAWHSAHAKAVGYPIATLSIWLFADVDCRGKAFSDVFAVGESTVKTTAGVDTSDGSSADDGGIAHAGGSGGATATVHCSNFNHLGDCCKRRTLNLGRCYCGRPRYYIPGRSKCNAQLQKVVKRVWYDNVSQKSCHC